MMEEILPYLLFGAAAYLILSGSPEQPTVPPQVPSPPPVPPNPLPRPIMDRDTGNIPDPVVVTPPVNERDTGNIPDPVIINPPPIPPINRVGYARDGSPVLASPQMNGLLLSNQNNEVGQLAPSPDRVKRLRTDDAFKRTYAFQSLAYSSYLTDEFPDGLVGPVTRRLIETVQRQSGRPVTGQISDSILMAVSSLAKIRQTRNLMPQVDFRWQPEWLPFDVVVSMNERSGYNRSPSTMTPIQTFFDPGFPYERAR